MSTDFDPTIELLTIAQVAEIFKISVPSVRRLQQRRLIPFFKIGDSVRFSRVDVFSFLKKQRIETIKQLTLWQYEN